MIRSLFYLTASRPDIIFSVCLCARFQSNSKESHVLAVKRIFKYLIGTQNIGLLYLNWDNFELIGYFDANFIGCKVDRKSTSRTCQLLRNKLISWFSKKQNLIALSTAKFEYIVAGSCCTFLDFSRTKKFWNKVLSKSPLDVIMPVQLIYLRIRSCIQEQII